MSIISSIISGGVGSIVKNAADVVDRFVETPEEKAKALKELREIEERETGTLLKATHAVIQEEARSEDPWVRRARPTFLWLMYVILGFNYIALPLLNVLSIALNAGITLEPITLPEELYWLFGSAYLGYAGARTWDKLIKQKGR